MNWGGHSREPVLWGGCYFDSITELAEYHNVTRGGLKYWLKLGKPFRGFEIIYLKEK